MAGYRRDHVCWNGHVDTTHAPANCRCLRRARSTEIIMLLEIVIVAISVVGFVLLDLYVLACEKV
jgi:hypothetical protein